MIAALCYLQYHSLRNHLAARFKRLRQPKYLIGAIVGGLYFYFYFFRYLFLSHGLRTSSHVLAIPPEHLALVESSAAALLFVIVILAWIIPHERAALTFTEAEIAFLFPAPVSRRMLINFKLIRSQLRILITSFFLMLLTNRFGGNALIHAAGWWIVLSTLNLHFLGSSFARTLLLDRGITNGLRRVLVLILAALMVGGIWWWGKKTMPGMNAAVTNMDDLPNYLQNVLTTGPALYLLLPFRLLVKPFFAPDDSTFFIALIPALLLFALHYLWVILSDVAFEEASLTASQKMAKRVAAMRSGNWAASQANQKAKRAWFKLHPCGPAYLALVWKNLIGVGRIFSRRFLIFVIVILGVVCASFYNSGAQQNLSLVAAFVLAICIGYSLLIGPQFLRLDFRYDLPQADIMKTFPMPSWQIALGEILGPIILLAGFQWLLLVPLIFMIFGMPGDNQPVFLAMAFSAMFVLPVLDCLLLVIPNAAVLLFPSWFSTGKDGPRGIEATGQRLVVALGQLLALLVAMLPAAVVFAIVFFPLRAFLGTAMPIFLGSLAGTIMLAVEAGLGVRLLGTLFEKFDVTELTAP